MIGDGGVAVCSGVVLDLVTAGGLAIERKAKQLEPPDNIAVAEPGESAH